MSVYFRKKRTIITLTKIHIEYNINEHSLKKYNILIIYIPYICENKDLGVRH